MMQNRIHLRRLLVIMLCSMGLMSANLRPAWAEPNLEPTVTYLAATNSIEIKNTVDTTLRVVTFTRMKELLGADATKALTEQGPGVWLLTAKILIDPNTRLEITNADLTEIRLDSAPLSPIFIQIQTGQLLLSGITLVGWDKAAGKPDENITDLRSYVAAVDGARIDIINSDVGYLGSSGTPPERNGLVWRKRLNAADPTTGSTGRIDGSKIHNNFVGLFASGAYSMTIANSEIYSNQGEGLLARDESQGFVISGNNVHNNTTEGINANLSTNMKILNNQVHDNTEEGILVESSSNNNTITGNTVASNAEGIVVARSINNLISGNDAHDNNKSGIRVSGDATNVASNNQVLNNTISNNTVDGLALFNHADKNLVKGNTVQGNKTNGINIKSGGNRIENNTSSGNAVGINISADDTTAPPSGDPPGSNNIIVGSILENNTDAGIRITGGSNNRIGPDANAFVASETNRIVNNSGDGIVIKASTALVATTDTKIFSNTIQSNRNGVVISEASSVRNRVSQNSITGNKSAAIKLDGLSQGAITAPVITAVLADGKAQGTAPVNAVVEVYTDPGSQAQTYLGSTTADASGKWAFQTTGLPFKQILALAIDGSNNTSALSERSGVTAPPFYTVAVDEQNQTVIQVTDGPKSITMDSILTGLGAKNTANLLTKLPNNVWQLNANLFIARGISLTLSTDTGVNELRLRSNASLSVTTSSANVIDYSSFVYLRTHFGSITINGIKLSSWDTKANAPDTDYSNGRAYIIAKYTAVMDISNAELSYLGSDDGESYGVTWRDVNDASAPDTLLTRVTGTVTNNKFHHNYYGIYTSQAQNMSFTGNQFYENVLYGFDPHDFSHDFLVENNLAYKNGAHGFIISRGCSKFTFRGNKSYSNFDVRTSQAHGFMLDPGSAGASTPQSPSFDNLLENNEAYDNEGFGLRITGSNNNVVRNNRFFRNLSGINIDQGSTDNTIQGNTITDNGTSGVILRGPFNNAPAANHNIVASNIITHNANNGIYIRSDNNVVTGNTVSGNLNVGIAAASEGDANLKNNLISSNNITNNGFSGIDIRRASTTTVEGNQVVGNSINGIYLTDSASQNLVQRNTVIGNTEAGVRISGAQSFGNTLSQNSITGNLKTGIDVSDNGNADIQPALSVQVDTRTVSGTAKPNSTIEIFTDDNAQGQYYQGTTTTAADGTFSFFTLPRWKGKQITTVVTDDQGNSSTYSSPIAAPEIADLYLTYLAVVKR